MFHSLRFRLFLTMSIVVLVAVGTLALFTSRSTTNAFQSYVQRDSEREQAFIESLLASYKGGQDTSNLQSAAKQMAQATGDRVIVAQGDGRVIADSDDQLEGQMLPWPLPAEKPFGVAGVTAEIPVTAPLPGADVIEGVPFVVRWTTAQGPGQGVGVGPQPGLVLLESLGRVGLLELGDDRQEGLGAAHLVDHAQDVRPLVLCLDAEVADDLDHVDGDPVLHRETVDGDRPGVTLRRAPEHGPAPIPYSYRRAADFVSQRSVLPPPVLRMPAAATGRTGIHPN